MFWRCCAAVKWNRGERHSIALLALTIALIVSAGVYLTPVAATCSRCIVGLACWAAAVNLIVFAANRFGPLQPAIIPAGATELAATAAQSLPQALVLTAMSSASLLCFALVLGARLPSRAPATT